MKFVGLATLSGFATLTLAADFEKFDTALPSGVDAASIAPVFDFDTDGCLPAAGISKEGDMNGGQKPSGSLTGACYSGNFLDLSNTYHRYLCKNSGGDVYCAHFYALYFEKDQLFSGIESGHRHDWEVAAVWTKNGVVTHGSASAHGDLDTRAASELPFENGHLKIVYHKEGLGSHAFRFASAGEVAENPYGRFVTPDIITWFEFSSPAWDNFVLRTILMRANYGSANLPIQDWNFMAMVNDFKPAEYPGYDWGDMFGQNPLPYDSHVYTAFYKFTVQNSGLCLDISGANLANNENLIAYSCTDGDNQQFYYDEQTHQIRTLMDPRWCVDAAAFPVTSNTNVQIYGCHGGQNQKWTRSGDVFYSEGTNIALDVAGSGAGSNVQVYPYWGGANQKWTLTH